MNILLTNDDGIHAPGLFALYRELKGDHEVHIVAPEIERSAVGHAITLNLPIRVRSVDRDGAFYGYAITGTPADCVKIAIQELMHRPPDVVLSGINLGANVGVDILYSGTVSAATEGAFMGVPAAAISLAARRDPDYRPAARFSRTILRFMTEGGLRKGTALNVNVPAGPLQEIRGVSLVRQGTAMYQDSYERRSDPRGNVYYWLTGETTIEDGGPDCDSVALREQMITITPIHYDLTCPAELERLKPFVPSLETVLEGEADTADRR